ncbi:Pleiotropic regulator 1 [Formica fusca]
MGDPTGNLLAFLNEASLIALRAIKPNLKSVRALLFHLRLYMFASASADNIKSWKCPEGKFIQNLTGHNAIINCLAVNTDGVLVSGADNGTMHLWDWTTGYNFQRFQAPVQPGSLNSETGVFSITFDTSGSRMITTDADKTIKVYKEEDTATEKTRPIHWPPDIIKRRKYSVFECVYIVITLIFILTSFKINNFFTLI